MGTKFNCLGPVCKEEYIPNAGKWEKSEVRQFTDQDVRDHGA